MQTGVRTNEGFKSMQAMALALLPTMTWRHHGIGCLQSYVVENVTTEIRLHVWAPELVKPGMDESGDVHDHRFDMVSHVLSGVVEHEAFNYKEDDAGDWSMMQLTHARAAKENAYHGPTTPLSGRYRVTRDLMQVPNGFTYDFPRGHFHRSPVRHGVAVTCVEKHNQTDTPARILYPTDRPPVMAFGHEMDWAVIGAVLKRALEALSRGV